MVFVRPLVALMLEQVNFLNSSKTDKHGSKAKVRGLHVCVHVVSLLAAGSRRELFSSQVYHERIFGIVAKPSVHQYVGCLFHIYCS